jgi:hypothetical protein
MDRLGDSRSKDISRSSLLSTHDDRQTIRSSIWREEIQNRNRLLDLAGRICNRVNLAGRNSLKSPTLRCLDRRADGLIGTLPRRRTDNSVESQYHRRTDNSVKSSALRRWTDKNAHTSVIEGNRAVLAKMLMRTMMRYHVQLQLIGHSLIIELIAT